MNSYKIDLSMYEGSVRELVSESVQKKAFKLEYYWFSDGNIIKNTGKPYLYFHKNGEIAYSPGRDPGYFESSICIQISANDFLNLTTAKDETIFKPSDKVLVRDGITSPWRLNYFSHMEGERFACVWTAWRQCIPYEGNEHLVGTTDKPINNA